MPDMQSELSKAMAQAKAPAAAPAPTPKGPETTRGRPFVAKDPTGITQREILWTWLKAHPRSTTSRMQSVLQWRPGVLDVTIKDLLLRKMVAREARGDGAFDYWTLGHEYRVREKQADSIRELEKKKKPASTPKPPVEQTLSAAVAIPGTPPPKPKPVSQNPDANVGFDPATFVRDLTFGQVKALSEYLQGVLK